MNDEPADSVPEEPAERTPDEEAGRYADGLAALLDTAGFPRMPARVLMALLTSPEGASTAERLSESLSASRAAISGATRYLESVQVIRVDSMPGSRRRMYRIAPEWYTVTLTRRSLYRELAERASRRPPGLEPGTEAGDRVQEMADFYAFLDRRFPELLEEWRAQR